MFRFEKLSLKQIEILSEILAKSTLREREFVKEKHLKMSSYFEETVEFLKTIDLIAKNRKGIYPRPLFQSILSKETETKKFLVDTFIVQKNPYTDYLKEFFSLFG